MGTISAFAFRHRETKKNIKFKPWGTTQKKAHNIQNTAKV
jgi:hypothetical protein